MATTDSRTRLVNGSLHRRFKFPCEGSHLGWFGLVTEKLLELHPCETAPR